MLKKIYEKILASFDSWDVFGFVAAMAELAAYVKDQWGGDAPPEGAAAAPMAEATDPLAYMRSYCECKDEAQAVQRGLFGGNFDWMGLMIKLIGLFSGLGKAPKAAKKS